MVNIIDGLSLLLATKFPTYPVYVNNQPEGFIRPSFFIDFIDDNTETLDHFTNFVTIQLQLVCFTPLDAYKTTDLIAQLTLYQQVKEVLSTGYFQAENTVVKIDKIIGGPKGNEIYLSLTLTWAEDKNLPTDNTDPMGDLYLNYNKEVN